MLVRDSNRCVKYYLTRFCALLGYCGKYESPEVNNRFESITIKCINKIVINLACKVKE